MSDQLQSICELDDLDEIELSVDELIAEPQMAGRRVPPPVPDAARSDALRRRKTTEIRVPLDGHPTAD